MFTTVVYIIVYFMLLLYLIRFIKINCTNGNNNIYLCRSTNVYIIIVNKSYCQCFHNNNIYQR